MIGQDRGNEMKSLVTRREARIIAIALILFISIIGNIYSFYKVRNYKYRLEKQCVTYIEDIKQRNESNMDILSQFTSEGKELNSISKEKLLQLYKNYDNMSKDITMLWQKYSDYSKNNSMIFNRKANFDLRAQEAVQNDIQCIIKEYLLLNINNEMKTEGSKFKIYGDDIERFKDMYELSKKLYDYFNNYSEMNFKDLSQEEKEKKIIKNHLWLDMLNNIYDIGNNYIEIQWN